MTGTALRVLIVDDEALAVDRLVHLCARLEDVDVVGTAPDGKTAQGMVRDLSPDLVLLDISMPRLDGMDLARTLATYDRHPAVIFVTAHSHHAVAAFELAATDYLLKPVSLARLNQAVARVRVGLQMTTPPRAHLTELWAPRGQDMVRLGVETVDLLESDRDYVRIHARGHAYLLRETLRNLEFRLDPSRFVRLHRSVIVPVDRIVRLQRGSHGGWVVHLSTGVTKRVGRSFQKSIQTLTAKTNIL